MTAMRLLLTKLRLAQATSSKIDSFGGTVKAADANNSMQIGSSRGLAMRPGGTREIVALGVYDWPAAYHDRLAPVAGKTTRGAASVDPRSIAPACALEDRDGSISYSTMYRETNAYLCHRNFTMWRHGRYHVRPWLRTEDERNV